LARRVDQRKVDQLERKEGRKVMAGKRKMRIKRGEGWGYGGKKEEEEKRKG